MTKTDFLSGLPALPELFKTVEKKKKSECNYPSLISFQCEQHYCNGFHLPKLIMNKGGISQVCFLAFWLSLNMLHDIWNKKHIPEWAFRATISKLCINEGIIMHLWVVRKGMLLISRNWETEVLCYLWYLKWRPNLDLVKDDSLF